MSDYTAKRRLYLGAGQYVEKGSPAPEMTPAERERLLASGAIAKAKAAKAEPEHDNKMEVEPENKTRGRKAKD